MRRKDYVVKLNKNDERLCTVLKHCQHLSKEQALRLASQNRINSYCKQGVLRTIYRVENNKSTPVYELTPKGRDWISKNFPHLRGNFYTSGPKSAMHNIKLAEQVIEHTWDNTRWLNERDLREILMREIEKAENRWEIYRLWESGRISVPDGAYQREDGTIECVEIYNNNYSQAELQSKAEFENVTGIPISYIKQ